MPPSPSSLTLFSKHSIAHMFARRIKRAILMRKPNVLAVSVWPSRMMHPRWRVQPKSYSNSPCYPSVCVCCYKRCCVSRCSPLPFSGLFSMWICQLRHCQAASVGLSSSLLSPAVQPTNTRFADRHRQLFNQETMPFKLAAAESPPRRKTLFFEGKFASSGLSVQHCCYDGIVDLDAEMRIGDWSEEKSARRAQAPAHKSKCLYIAESCLTKAESPPPPPPRLSGLGFAFSCQQ